MKWIFGTTVKVVAQGWTNSPKAMAGSAVHPSAGRESQLQPPERHLIDAWVSDIRNGYLPAAAI